MTNNADLDRLLHRMGLPHGGAHQKPQPDHAPVEPVTDLREIHDARLAVEMGLACPDDLEPGLRLAVETAQAKYARELADEDYGRRLKETRAGIDAVARNLAAITPESVAQHLAQRQAEGEQSILDHVSGDVGSADFSEDAPTVGIAEFALIGHEAGVYLTLDDATPFE